MMAVKCPICEGSGWTYDFLQPTKVVPCHGCANWGSKGWVIIPAEMTYSSNSNDINCPDCGMPRDTPCRIGCRKGSHYGNYCSIV